jgi:GT2 family glycosyltransferase
MSQGNPSIALLMVTYNRSDLLRQILQSIHGFHWEVSDFIIIDNGSEDSTAVVLEEFKDSLDLLVISESQNVGHGAGLALGLAYIQVKNPKLDFVIFLEDDSIPQAGYLEFLLGKIKNSDFSMISSAGSLVSLGKRTKLEPNESEILAADFALFDGAIARFQDLLIVGFPVRDWFMMFDDFEYCYRIRKKGFKIGVVSNPHLEILHEGWGGGVSHSHLWRSYYQSRNYIHFVRIHFSAFIFLDFLILQGKRLIGGFFAPNGMATTKMRLMGIRAGLIGKKGKSLDIIKLKEV